jgi:hypothetical protein
MSIRTDPEPRPPPSRRSVPTPHRVLHLCVDPRWPHIETTSSTSICTDPALRPSPLCRSTAARVDLLLAPSSAARIIVFCSAWRPLRDLLLRVVRAQPTAMSWELLVQRQGRTTAEATWEEMAQIKEAYLDFELEDELFRQGEGSVMNSFFHR